MGEDDSMTASASGDEDASVCRTGSAQVQTLSRAQKLRKQSNMSFWLILKKKNDFQAKAARVQELRAMLEKIRLVVSSNNGGHIVALVNHVA